MNTKDINIKMLLPVSEGRPLVPLDYNMWFLSSKGFEGFLIDFVEYNIKTQRITFKEYIDATYINLDGTDFLRYDHDKKTLYSYKDQGTPLNTVQDLIDYCELRKCKIKLVDRSWKLKK